MNKPARFLVSYDISHPKRLRRVAKAMEGISVFECVFDAMPQSPRFQEA